jgi:hypothetical protein
VTPKALLLTRPWGVAAAILTSAILVTYVSIIIAEGNNSVSDVLPWALLMLVGAGSAFVGSQIADRNRAKKMMFIAAGILLAMGALSVFSIGLGLIAAGALALVGAMKLSGAEDQN